MENNQPRVLAYTLAQPISDEQLQEISGGAAQLTGRPTFRFSGVTNSHDFVMDFSWDW